MTILHQGIWTCNIKKSCKIFDFGIVKVIKIFFWGGLEYVLIQGPGCTPVIDIL